MNRVQLIDAISKETGVSKKDVDAVLTSTLSNIKGSVKRGDTVQLIGFGSFKPVTRKARKGINPKTGETIKISAKKVVKFTSGSAFIEQLNAKKAPAKKPATSAKKPTAKAKSSKSTAKKSKK